MKLKGIVFLCSMLFLASCGAKKTVVNKENPGVVIVEPEPVDLPSVNEKEITKKLVKKNPNLNTLTIDYIRKYAPIAVKECFRKYVYPETSYNDHSLFLTQRRRYAFLFGYKITDYKRWANGLKKAGYATDPKYPAKLIKIIKDYKLYEFDKISKRAYSKEILALNDGESFEKPTVIQKTEPKFYEVEKGDTLYSIGRKFGVSVPVLKKLNNLKDNTISIGQKLVLN